jgi:hypothetical protein
VFKALTTSTPKDDAMIKRALLCCLFWTTMFNANAWADPVTLRFTVVVEQADGPTADLFGVPIVVGDLLPGAFKYNPLAPPWVPPSEEVGLYRDREGVIRLDSFFSMSNVLVGVIDGAPGRFFTFDSIGILASSFNMPGFSSIGMIVTVDDKGASQGSSFSGVSLPTSAAPWIALPNKSFGLSAFKITEGDPDQLPDIQITGRVLLQDVQPVPEPTSLLLLGSGLGAMAARGLRRRSPKCHTPSGPSVP